MAIWDNGLSEQDNLGQLPIVSEVVAQAGGQWGKMTMTAMAPTRPLYTTAWPKSQKALKHQGPHTDEQTVCVAVLSWAHQRNRSGEALLC